MSRPEPRPPLDAIETLPDLFEEAAKLWGEQPAFARRVSKTEWEPLSFRALRERGRHVAAALIELGVGWQDKVGLFADNCMEWIIADCALQFCGAVDVPRGSDITDGELRYIVKHAELRYCIVENATLTQRIGKLLDEEAENNGEKQTPPQCIILKHTPDSGPISLATLEQRGASLLSGKQAAKYEKHLSERRDRLQHDSLFTLIYTSGTTGVPKGVPLTHANIISQIRNIPVPLTWRDRVLSILPIWHVYERVLEMITLYRGTCTYYSDIRHFADDLLAVEPTFMGSAPRLWQSLHDRILRTISRAHPVRRALFHSAMWCSHHYFEATTHLCGREVLEHPPVPWKRGLRRALEALRWLLILPLYGFLNATVLERVRQSVGGCLSGTISGGGALPPHIDRFFQQLGIRVLEGYGLTETSPVLAVRTLDQLILTTVGAVIPETELRIVDPETEEILYPNPSTPDGGRMQRGEIQVRGPQIMSGYYNNPEATEAVLNNGWCRTGDLGLVTWNECLRIVGRSKETLVLLSGENVEPGPIEQRLQQSPLIDQVMVVGNDRPHLGALVIPSNEAKAKFGEELTALEKGLTKEVHRLVSKENGFKSFEHIPRIAVEAEPFSVDDELTKLFKLKRHVIAEQRADAIDRIYARHGKQGTQR